tara:strand:+ start:66 stop:257 length:192 start_codon:yes stop_codon:yes gene_type:complete
MRLVSESNNCWCVYSIDDDALLNIIKNAKDLGIANIKTIATTEDGGNHSSVKNTIIGIDITFK